MPSKPEDCLHEETCDKTLWKKDEMNSLMLTLTVMRRTVEGEMMRLYVRMMLWSIEITCKDGAMGSQMLNCDETPLPMALVGEMMGDSVQ